MYKLYLSINEKMLPWSIERCCDQENAAAAFSDLVNCRDLEFADFVAVLEDRHGTLAQHRYTDAIGSPDFWRGRIQDIPWKNAKRRFREGRNQ